MNPQDTIIRKIDKIIRESLFDDEEFDLDGTSVITSSIILKSDAIS